MIEQSDLENRFTYHPPSGDDQVALYQLVRRMGKDFAQLINERVPDGREKSVAFTKIEEAVMWANAGIARSDDDGTAD